MVAIKIFSVIVFCVLVVSCGVSESTHVERSDSTNLKNYKVELFDLKIIQRLNQLNDSIKNLKRDAETSLLDSRMNAFDGINKQIYSIKAKQMYLINQLKLKYTLN